MRKSTVILQADSETRAKQIAQNLVDYGVDIPIVKSDQIIENKSQITVGDFAHGFAIPSLDLVYLTERELFNQRPHHRKRIKTL